MKTVMLIFVVFVQFNSYAQDITTTISGVQSNFQDLKKNTIYFEGLGNGAFYSINYDRLLTPNIACRVGFSFFPSIIPDAPIYLFTLPISASYLLNLADTPSYLETGIGITPLLQVYERWLVSPTVPSTTSVSQIDVVLAPMLGYRLQPKQGGFNFRLLWTPLIIVTQRFTPSLNPTSYWFGVSLGHTF
jgi:hypothetical protein